MTNLAWTKSEKSVKETRAGIKKEMYEDDKK